MIFLNELKRIQSKFKIYSLFALSLTAISVPAVAQSSKTLKTIVLDAGHGGKDPGAHGIYSNEKDITLAVVLKLGKILNDSMPRLNVIYTRKTDVFIDLKERGPIGNRAVLLPSRPESVS